MLRMLPSTGFTQERCVFIPQESTATVILPHHTNIEQLQILSPYLSYIFILLFCGGFFHPSQQPLWNCIPQMDLGTKVVWANLLIKAGIIQTSRTVVSEAILSKEWLSHRRLPSSLQNSISVRDTFSPCLENKCRVG